MATIHPGSTRPRSRATSSCSAPACSTAGPRSSSTGAASSTWSASPATRATSTLPVWRWYNRVAKASGDVGIWHETDLVPAGQYEAIYGNMPRIGLAAAGRHVPIARRGETAAERVGTMANDEVEAST
jgi:hypothetical protein